MLYPHSSVGIITNFNGYYDLAGFKERHVSDFTICREKEGLWHRVRLDRWMEEEIAGWEWWQERGRLLGRGPSAQQRGSNVFSEKLGIEAFQMF